jgi:drug/metabolite transporter (DMT)-like permease
MMFVLGGVLYSAQAFLYFSSLRYIPAALTSLLLYTYPFFVALLASVVDKERLTRDNFLAATLGMAGLFLVLGASPAAVNVTGLLMALAAAVVYSAYLILGTRVVKELSPLVTSAFVAGWAALAMLTAGVAGESLDFSLSPLAWAAIAGIVAFATIMAMLTLFRGLDLIGPTRLHPQHGRTAHHLRLCCPLLRRAAHAPAACGRGRRNCRRRHGRVVAGQERGIG